MNKALLTGLCMFILLVSSAFAIPQNYEVTSVSRIVGDSPEDMAGQLMTSDLNLHNVVEVGYDPSYGTAITEINNVLSSQAQDYSNTGDFNIASNLKDALSQGSQDHYLVLNTKFSGVFTDQRGMSDAGDFDLDDVKEWATDLDDGSLTILNSPYGGLYLPKQDSLVGEFAPRSSLIGSASFSSYRFVLAVVCNMGRYDSVGEVFRQARNNYHYNTQNPGEYIGLSLVSFHLYGSPLREVSLPNFETDEWIEYCQDYEETFTSAAFSTTETLSDFYTRNYELIISDHEIVDAGNYSYLSTDQTLQSWVDGRLVLPRRQFQSEMPLKTIINNISLISLQDPVSLTINKLPTSLGERPVDRVCQNNSQPVLLESTYGYTGSSQSLVLSLTPLEVVDCAQGEVKLYKKIQFQVEYLPLSPVFFNSIQTSDRILPGTLTSITVDLENIKAQAASGKLVLREGGEVVAEQSIRVGAQGAQTIMAFSAPDEEGLHSYTLQFVQNDEVMTQIDFTLAVDLLQAALVLPNLITQEVVVPLVLNNRASRQMDVKIRHVLKAGEDIIIDSTQERSLAAGFNFIDFSFSDLKREDQSYTLLVDLLYEGRKQSVSTILTTNHGPVLSPIAPITLNEGEPVSLFPTATDKDHDYVTLTISDPVGDDGVWYTNFNDAGNYTVTVSASDGLLTDSQEITIEVLNQEDPRQVIFRDCNFGLYRGGFAELAVDFDFDGQLESWYSTQSSELQQAFGFRTAEGWPLGSCGFNDDFLCIEDSDASDPDWFSGADSFPDSVYSLGGSCDTSSNPNPSYLGHEVCLGEVPCEYPLCSFNYECGNSSWIGDSYCVGDAVYLKYRNFSCTQAGSYGATCSYNDTTVELEACTSRQVCASGSCVDVACYNDSECGAAGYLGAYCTGPGAYNDYRTWSCQNPGEATAVCVATDRTDHIQDCNVPDETCIYGLCVPKDFAILGTFDDGDENKSFTFIQAGNNTLEITLPKNAEIRNATIDVGGGP